MDTRQGIQTGANRADDPRGAYCRENHCPWLSGSRCTGPHDPWKNECDYDWAARCPSCGRLVAAGEDDDGVCPFCGEEIDL